MQLPLTRILIMRFQLTMFMWQPLTQWFSLTQFSIKPIYLNEHEYHNSCNLWKFCVSCCFFQFTQKWILQQNVQHQISGSLDFFRDFFPEVSCLCQPEKLQKKTQINFPRSQKYDPKRWALVEVIDFFSINFLSFFSGICWKCF